MHNFLAKLCDPRVKSALQRYLDWARGKDNTDDREIGDPDLFFAPVSINLDLTVACDYACDHCVDRGILNTGKRFDFDTLVESLSLLRMAGLASVILIGGGEPTLYPKFQECVVAIKALGLQCAVVSNGAHNERIAAVASVFQPGDWIRLSLDAATDATFQRLHRPRRRITLEEICVGAQAIKTRAPWVTLGFSFIVFWQESGQRFEVVHSNVGEIAPAARLAREVGFDYISFKPNLARSEEGKEVINVGPPSSSPNGTVPQWPVSVVTEIRRKLHEAKQYETKNFHVIPSLNLTDLLEPARMSQAKQQPRRCHMQRFRQVLTPNGIFACPAYRGDRRSLLAYADGYASLENLLQTARSSLRQVAQFDAAKECREITCIYNRTNWRLEMGLEPGELCCDRQIGDLFL